MSSPAERPAGSDDDFGLRKELLGGLETPSDAQRLFLGIQWRATNLGAPSTWSPTLRAAVSTCLTTRFPMLVMAGDDLTMVYNDGYAHMLGLRHPDAMGRPLREVWSDVWDDISGLVDSVRTQKRAMFAENLPLVMGRNGFDEETYWTFSYSPLLSPEGTVVGVLNTATEATPGVLAARRLTTVAQLTVAGNRRHPTLRAASAALLEVLADTRTDVPTAALYLLEDPSDPTSALLLHGAQGTGTANVPSVIVLGGPIGAQLRTTVHRQGPPEPVLITDLDTGWPGLQVAPVEVGGGPVTSAVLLPLSTPGRRQPVGVLVLGLSPHLSLDPLYRTFVQLVGSQVATVIGDTLDHLADQAAHAQHRSLAEALQRSLLTEPIQSDDLQIVARYRPAVTAAQVGGDWYDAFLCQDGSTWLVVGDVAGHDQQAAAAMAQIRNMVRTLAYTMEDSPAAVLQAVDRAMAGLQVQTMTTALAMRIEQTAEQRAAGIRQLRWSNAGHPPPVHATADSCGARAGRVLSTHPELPLGVAADTARTDHHIDLAPGDDVVLYTDGLIERRGQDLDDGIAWLSGSAAAIEPGHGIETWADELINSIRRHADDDVAVLVVRAHPQDRPLPLTPA